ncbi:uncharacterized protein SAPINGB_P005285 [Magnusiomyces paraingens]|uniref:Uncharacterized protein n=1 Tax=Magnusiomyces paraingens TaxID=2606893 RepID=A0A5E8C4P2_9ASCO|nr:uncharacterized protein SAPINGB_P005285 [Saprochaete ingens]VVT56798.1 unnamed protein product [Saprochaete ingens]
MEYQTPAKPRARYISVRDPECTYAIQCLVDAVRLYPRRNSNQFSKECLELAAARWRQWQEANHRPVDASVPLIRSHYHNKMNEFATWRKRAQNPDNKVVGDRVFFKDSHGRYRSAKRLPEELEILINELHKSLPRPGYKKKKMTQEEAQRIQEETKEKTWSQRSLTLQFPTSATVVGTRAESLPFQSVPAHPETFYSALMSDVAQAAPSSSTSSSSSSSTSSSFNSSSQESIGFTHDATIHPLSAKRYFQHYATNNQQHRDMTAPMVMPVTSSPAFGSVTHINTAVAAAGPVTPPSSSPPMGSASVSPVPGYDSTAQLPQSQPPYGYSAPTYSTVTPPPPTSYSTLPGVYGHLPSYSHLAGYAHASEHGTYAGYVPSA